MVLRTPYRAPGVRSTPAVRPVSRLLFVLAIRGCLPALSIRSSRRPRPALSRLSASPSSQPIDARVSSRQMLRSRSIAAGHQFAVAHKAAAGGGGGGAMGVNSDHDRIGCRPGLRTAFARSSPTRDRPHGASVMWCCAVTRPHFLYSACMNVPSCCAVPPTGTAPE